MKNKGFSLVELIVVIAIMAILVGVAVPVYSSYIEKTQIAKDKQLVGEVAHALQIGYAANGGESAPAYVILYTNKDAEGNATAQALLAEIFPNLSDLRLEYDGWGDSTTLGFLANMNQTSAESILGSSYLTGSNVNDLLGEVSTLTGAAFDFIGLKLGNSPLLYENMRDNFGAAPVEGETAEELAARDAAFIATCANYGIKVKQEDGKYVFDNSNATELQTQLSNFMVMAAAEDFANAASGGGAPSSPAAGLVLTFAKYNAVANSTHAADSTLKQEYAALTEKLADATSLPEVTGLLEEFENGEAYQNVYAKYEKDDTLRTYDETAVVSIMMAVGNASDIVTADDMKNPDLYGSDTISGYLNSYVASAGLVAGLGEEVVAALQEKLAANPGAVAIYMVNGVIGCTDLNLYNS